MDQWKQRIQNVEKALQRQRMNAHQVATDLVAVHDDPEFLASETIQGDHDKAIEYLETFAVKLFVIVPQGRSPYLDLAAMLREFPNKRDWSDGDLSKMYDAMLEKTTVQEDPAPARKRQSVTRAQYEELQTEVERLRYENTQLHKRVAELQTELHEMRSAKQQPATV